MGKIRFTLSSEEEQKYQPERTVTAKTVMPNLRLRWPAFATENLKNHPALTSMDALVAEGRATVESSSCGQAADKLKSLIVTGNERLYGDLQVVGGNADDCWSVHLPGLIGPGLEVILGLDGEILAVVMIVEG